MNKYSLRFTRSALLIVKGIGAGDATGTFFFARQLDETKTSPKIKNRREARVNRTTLFIRSKSAHPALRPSRRGFFIWAGISEDQSKGGP